VRAHIRRGPPGHHAGTGPSPLLGEIDARVTPALYRLPFDPIVLSTFRAGFEDAPAAVAQSGVDNTREPGI